MNRRTIAPTLLTVVAVAGLTGACSATDSATPSTPASSRAVDATITQAPVSTPQAAQTPAPQQQAPTTTDQQQGSTPAASPTPAPAADHCDSVSASTLATIAANSSIAYRIAAPIVFDRVQCAGSSAVARTAPDGVHQPSTVLFRYSPGEDAQWVAVDIGSAIDCGRFGATPAEIAQLEGCL